MSARIELTNRDVIENKLLFSLNDKPKVALLLTHDELTLLIDAVRSSFINFSGDSNELFSMYTDLRKLRDAAFGRL